MKLQRLLAVAVAFFLSAPLSVAAETNTIPESTPIDLKNAILFAIQNSPALDSIKKTQSIRELERSSAIAKLLPSLDFTTSNGLQNNIPVTFAPGLGSLLNANPSAPWFSTVNLGVTETLYDNGASINRLKIAGSNQEIATINSLKNRDSLALDIAGEFYRYSLATELLQVRKQQQAILEKQFNTLSNQFQQGFKTRSDFLRIKTQVQRAEIERVTAENNIILNTTELRKLLGASYKNTDNIKFSPIPVDRKQDMGKLFPQRPPQLEEFYDFRIATIQKEANERTVSLARRNYWPQLSVSAGISYTNQDFLTQNNTTPPRDQLSWNAIFTLQYNIWDWGTLRRAVQAAEYERDIQENTLNQTLLEVNAKIVGVMADLSRIARNYKLSQDLLALEEESNRNLEIQYREGKVTYLDLITSINNLLDAKVQFYTAYFDSLQSLAKYRYYEGKIYESLVEK